MCAQRAGGVKPMPAVRGSETAAEAAREFLGPKLALQEVVGVLLLSSDLSPIGFAMPHVGGLAASIVEPAAVLRPAPAATPGQQDDHCQAGPNPPVPVHPSLTHAVISSHSRR
ncbi:MAG: hypothetical protein WCI73_02130 [Phycisphaerae bacterium]